MTDDIDWLAVELVCEGQTLALTRAEKRMVIARMAAKLLQPNESPVVMHWKITGAELGRRLGMSQRNVERIAADLPEADERTCPVCRGTMWVLWTGVVEPHGDGFHETCVMSDRLFGNPLKVLPMPAGLRRRRVAA